MESVLVTGGAGFIGSHLIEKLSTDKYQAVAFDNLSTGILSYLPQKIIFEKGDVRKTADIDRVFKKYKFSVVCHIAGQASNISSFTDPYIDIDTNYTGTVNITLACLKYQVKRLLYASSMTVYGLTSSAPINEDHLCQPISYYGISKYAAERFVLSTSLRRDLTTKLHPTAFRMFNVYGTRQSLNNPYQGVLAIFLGNVLRGEPIKIFGDGKQSRDFINVADVVSAWTDSIHNSFSYNRVFNLGSGKSISIKQLAISIVTALGKNPKTYPVKYFTARPGDQRHMQADISLAKTILDFKPQIKFDHGIKTTIAWARKEKINQISSTNK